MGKKRIARKTGREVDASRRARALARGGKRKLEAGTLHIEATYNNTKVTLADQRGNVVAWSSSGALGFQGAKKGTPFAAAKVGELMGEKAAAMGLKELSISVKGVGAGRESAIRAFTARGFTVGRIVDVTPIPHNGPRPPKPRRI